MTKIIDGNYRYKIYSTNASSQKYGVCQVCGKHATEVFHQTEERHFKEVDEKENIIDDGFTHYKCNNYFGHKECLESKQR